MWFLWFFIQTKTFWTKEMEPPGHIALKLFQGHIFNRLWLGITLSVLQKSDIDGHILSILLKNNFLAHGKYKFNSINLTPKNLHQKCSLPEKPFKMNPTTHMPNRLNFLFAFISETYLYLARVSNNHSIQQKLIWKSFH